MSVGQISAAVAGRGVDAVVAEARDVVEPVYRAVVDGMPAEVRHIAGYHVGWWDADGRPTRQAGKAVRPAVALACARAAGGVLDEAAIAAGVAVELVHDFSLLHDDVMDGDLTRRHRPTAWAVFGIGPAILVGDVLLTTAMEQAGTGAGVRVLAQAVQDLRAGQSADLAFEERDDVEVAECLAMAEGKTGALLGAACELGALAGGAGPAAADRYRAFGRQLGVAFQLVDDLLGIWGDPAVTGKPAGADLVARKKSLPVVAALTSGTQAGTHLAYLYGRDETWDETAIAHIAGLVEAAGGRQWAQAEADRRIDAALTALREAHPAPAARLQVDLYTLTAKVQAAFDGFPHPLRVAVMGCVVNGPGEARESRPRRRLRQRQKARSSSAARSSPPSPNPASSTPSSRRHSNSPKPTHMNLPAIPVGVLLPAPAYVLRGLPWC